VTWNESRIRSFKPLNGGASNHSRKVCARTTGSEDEWGNAAPALSLRHSELRPESQRAPAKPEVSHYDYDSRHRPGSGPRPKKSPGSSAIHGHDSRRSAPVVRCPQVLLEAEGRLACDVRARE